MEFLRCLVHLFFVFSFFLLASITSPPTNDLYSFCFSQPIHKLLFRGQTYRLGFFILYIFGIIDLLLHEASIEVVWNLNLVFYCIIIILLQIGRQPPLCQSKYNSDQHCHLGFHPCGPWILHDFLGRYPLIVADLHHLVNLVLGVLSMKKGSTFNVSVRSGI